MNAGEMFVKATYNLIDDSPLARIEHTAIQGIQSTGQL